MLTKGFLLNLVKLKTNDSLISPKSGTVPQSQLSEALQMNKLGRRIKCALPVRLGICKGGFIKIYVSGLLLDAYGSTTRKF